MHRPPDTLKETPKAILKCTVDPIAGIDFHDWEAADLAPMVGLQSMPTGCKMVIAADGNAADRIRRSYLESKVGDCELVLATIGNVGLQARLQAYKVEPGTYYQPLRDWLFQALDDMAPDSVYFLEFRSYDSIQLAFHMAKEWEKDRAAIIRLGATYEGRHLTLRAYRPERTINQFEFERLQKAQSKRQQRQDKEAQKADRLRNQETKKLTRAANQRDPAEPSTRVKPYHSLTVGQQLELQPGEFTNIMALRTIVCAWGTRNGQRLRVAKQGDGALITRLE